MFMPSCQFMITQGILALSPNLKNMNTSPCFLDLDVSILSVLTSKLNLFRMARRKVSYRCWRMETWLQLRSLARRSEDWVVLCFFSDRCQT